MSLCFGFGSYTSCGGELGPLSPRCSVRGSRSSAILSPSKAASSTGWQTFAATASLDLLFPQMHSLRGTSHNDRVHAHHQHFIIMDLGSLNRHTVSRSSGQRPTNPHAQPRLGALAGRWAAFIANDAAFGGSFVRIELNVSNG
jgi:hypothetical protein